MTAAHRTTFKPALGGNDQGANKLLMPSRQFSSKDLPSCLTLKKRENYDIKPIKNINLLKEKLIKKENKEIKIIEFEEQTLDKNHFSEDDDDEDILNQSSENSSDNEDELLLLEYEKIKKEKEQKNIIHDNDIDIKKNYSLKRRWYEDTVFRNQALKGKKKEKKFVNDNLRSDFNKEFLNKFLLM